MGSEDIFGSGGPFGGSTSPTSKEFGRSQATVTLGDRLHQVGLDANTLLLLAGILVAGAVLVVLIWRK